MTKAAHPAEGGEPLSRNSEVPVLAGRRAPRDCQPLSLLARRLGTGAACATSSTVRALSVPLVARGGTLLAAERAARSHLTSGSARFAGACIGAMPTFVLAAAVLISAITWPIAIATNARTKLLIALGAAPSPDSESPGSTGSSSSLTSCSGRETATLQKGHSSSSFGGSFCGSTSEKSTIHSARARSSSKVMISDASTFRR